MAEAIAELEKRLDSARAEAVDPIAKIDALNDLAWELRNKEVGRAHELASEARELALEHGYKLGQARAARTMAMSIRDTDALRTLYPRAEEAKRLFDEVGDGPGRAASRDFLSSLHEFMGDLAGGLEYALDALAIACEIGDPVRQGYALSSVGGILAGSGEPDEAIERLKEALALFEEAERPEGTGTICSRLAKVLKGVGRYDEGLHYARLCRDAAEATDDMSLLSTALRDMGELEEARGRIDEAERLFRESLAAIQSRMHRHVMGTLSQMALGRLLIKRDKLDEAEAELEDVLARVGTDPLLVMSQAQAHEALAELRERQDEPSKAVEHLRKAQDLRVRIAQQDARNKLAQVEARAAIEAAKKDAEIQKLRFVELHGMQSKLVEAEKMALLGKLAAGTAHELNTPLGVLRSNTKLVTTAIERLIPLLQSESAKTQAAKLASVLESCEQTSNEAVERIGAIAESFKRFTQLDQAERRSFDLNEGLQSALALLEPTLSVDIQIRRGLGDVPELEGWPRELNHAFLTVLQNAAQAIDGAGVVTVETASTDEHVLARVRDTGRGMSDEQVKHLFDVAWSEDGTRTTMRLGLSAAYSTMQKHDGTLEVESELGEGTVVTFRFPRG